MASYGGGGTVVAANVAHQTIDHFFGVQDPNKPKQSVSQQPQQSQQPQAHQQQVVAQQHSLQAQQPQQLQQQQQQQQRQKQQETPQNINNNGSRNVNNQSTNSGQNYNGFMTYRDSDQENENYGRQTQYDTNNSQKSLSLEYGKTIKLLRNGDEFYRGHKIVINSRKYRYFNVFLDDVSDSLNARFGAVRSIHTPINGHKIQSLDQIEDGKTYVAAGSGRFVRLNYLDISEGKKPPNRLPSLNRQPVDYNNIQVPQYNKSQNVYIYVYRNGDILTPPSKVLLNKNTLASYDAVLNEVTLKVQLLNGAVMKLFTMDGEPILSPAQLQNATCYVAANKERFKKCEYFPPQDFGGSPRMNRKSNSQPVSHTSSNASTSGKSTFSYSGKPYSGWHKDNSLPPVRTNNNSNNQNASNQKLNLDKDEGGIYKARNNQNNNDQAKTIPDGKNMYVDMPVDYKKANQINNEDIRNDRQNVQPQQQNQIAKPNSKPPPQSNTTDQQIRKESDNPKPNEQQNMNAQKQENKQPAQPAPQQNQQQQQQQQQQHQPDAKTNANNNSNNLVSSSQTGVVNKPDDKPKQAAPAEQKPEQKNPTNEPPKTNNTAAPPPHPDDFTRDEAATKIQSFFRGYKTRSELKNKNPNAFN